MLNTFAVVHQDMQILGGLKHTVNLGYIWVVEGPQYIDLIDRVVLRVHQCHLLLGEDLQSVELAVFGGGQKHFTEGSFAEFSDDFVADGLE